MNHLLPRIDTYHLLIFFYVCKEKGITAAAEKLFLSQPTVTNHIKSLEESIQMKLVRIERKKLVLTRVGEGLYHYASEIFRQTMAADRFVEIVRKSSLYIGVNPLLVRIMAKTVNQISREFDPSVRLDICFGESLDLVNQVIDSKLDLAIVPKIKYDSPDLTHIRLANGIKLLFFASPSHPIFSREQIGWAELGDYPVILGTEASALKQLIASKLLGQGLKTPPQFNFTANNVEFLKSIAQYGSNISIAAEEDIKPELERGILKVIPIPDDISMDIDAISHKSHFSTVLVQDFIACAKNALYVPDGCIHIPVMV
jgi:DNA-binding transcriptional LysR family regulator